MQEENAMEFFDRITQGTKKYETITLEHKSGAALSGVEVHPVDKGKLANTIERLPEAIFEAAEGAEDAEDAEDVLEEETGSGIDAVTEDTVAAFEDLAKQSLKHGELSPPQMKQVVNELSFEVLFRVGTKIIQLSVEQTGEVEDFHEQA